MIIFGLKNCDACRKALKKLPEAAFCDVRAEGVPENVLKSAYARFGERLVNTRSTTWRSLSEAERATDPLGLLVAHPALISHPAASRQCRKPVGGTRLMTYRRLFVPAGFIATLDPCVGC